MGKKRLKAVARRDAKEAAEAAIPVGGSGDDEWSVLGIPTGVRWWVVARALLVLLPLALVAAPTTAWRNAALSLTGAVIAANSVGKKRAPV